MFSGESLREADRRGQKHHPMGNYSGLLDSWAKGPWVSLAPQGTHARPLLPPCPPSQGRAHLVHADIAFVTEDHLVSIFALRRAAHVTHNVLVVLDAQPFFGLNGPHHILVAQCLQLLQHTL